MLINKVLLSYSIARINTNLYLLERALFKRFEPIQWVNIDVKRNHLDLRVIYVKIYLLVRAYIMIGLHTFISLVEIYFNCFECRNNFNCFECRNNFNCFECRNNLLEHTGLTQQVFVLVSRFHRDLFLGVKVA